MEIPIYKSSDRRPAIDFCPFARELEKAYGFEHRDMGGKYKHQREAKEVADKIDGSDGWYTTRPADYNEKQKEASDVYHELLKSSPPYQDVWHWLLDNDFDEFQRGSDNNYLSFSSLEEEETPEYVKVFLRAVQEVVKDHPAYDGEDVRFHIDW